MTTTAQAIQQGNQVRLSVEFKSETGELTNPTSVSCQIQSPDGRIETPAPTHDTIGKWHYVLTVGLPGRWQYRFAGTGVLVAAAESEFWVANSDLV